MIRRALTALSTATLFLVLAAAPVAAGHGNQPVRASREPNAVTKEPNWSRSDS